MVTRSVIQLQHLHQPGVSSLTGGSLYYPPSGSISLFAIYPAASASSHSVTSVTEVKMKNVKRIVSVAPTTSSAGVGSAESSTDGNGDEILIFSGSNTSSETQTYACVFPSQAWNNTDFITVTADEKTVTYQLNRSEWTAGAEYELTFHLNAVALSTGIR